MATRSQPGAPACSRGARGPTLRKKYYRIVTVHVVIQSKQSVTYYNNTVMLTGMSLGEGYQFSSACAKPPTFIYVQSAAYLWRVSPKSVFGKIDTALFTGQIELHCSFFSVNLDLHRQVSKLKLGIYLTGSQCIKFIR